MDLEQQINFPTTELETVTIRFAGDSGDGTAYRKSVHPVSVMIETMSSPLDY